MSNLINNGQATTIWNGISHTYLITRCAQATPDEADAMSTAASLMVAGECSYEEFNAARTALASVEDRMCAEWEKINGKPVRNRNGQILGGSHPAITPNMYAEALANRTR